MTIYNKNYYKNYSKEELISEMDWKDKRINEINKDISNQINQQARECVAQNYIEEYHNILNSDAKTFEEFKQQQLKQGRK